MRLLQVQNSLLLSLVASVTIFTIGVLMFELMEPAVTNAANTSTFNVSQTVTGQVSFKTPATNITMNPSIAGLTGGVASGTTTAVVLTNNSLGYNMTIHFSSSTAMDRNGGGGYISNYTPTASGTPDMTVQPQAYGQFAYSAYSTTNPADMDTKFLNNGTACNSGTNSTAGKCWFNPTNGTALIVNRTTATPITGATTSIAFQVNVPNNPNPSIPTGTYTATATLTALTN